MQMEVLWKWTALNMHNGDIEQGHEDCHSITVKSYKQQVGMSVLNTLVHSGTV